MGQKNQEQFRKNQETFPDIKNQANTFAAQMPQLAAQWDTEKNAPLMPEQVMCGSHKKVWWRCDSGHSWQAQVRNRARGQGCPICINQKIIVGTNDWVTRYPAAAAQWDADKNGCAPEQVRSDDRKRYWWHCEKGHSWQTTIRIRIRPKASGCPYCAGRRVQPGENDLQTLCPDLAAQWDMEKNAPLRPSEVTPGCNKTVFWRCLLGHSYRAEISIRTGKHSGCPYCAGRRVLAGFNDLQTLHPEVAAQWHPSLNGDLKTTDVTRGSDRKVWWQCAWGHEWQAYIYSRTGTFATGCPYCAKPRKIAKDLAFDYDRIIKNRDHIEERAKAAQQTRKGALYL